MLYLRGNEVANHEGQRQHEHLDAIACEFGVLSPVDVQVIEMSSVLQCDLEHRHVCQTATTAESQACPHLLEASLVIRGLPFEESRTDRRRTCVYL